MKANACAQGLLDNDLQKFWRMFIQLYTRRMAIANKTCVSGKKLISIIDYDVCMTFY